jgi:hypothetical protein
MAGTFGYFLQGMAGGIQSSFEMGWKKKQKKELEAAQKKIAEEGAILNNAVQDMMDDKIITDDEMIRYEALLFASGKEVQDMSKGWTDAIRNMNKEGAEQYKEKFEMFTENLGNFDLKNFEASYQEAVKLYPTQKTSFDAAYEIIKRKSEIPEKPDISQELDISAKLPEEYRYPYLKGEGVVGEITPTEEAPKEPSAADRKLDMVVNQYAKDLITFNQLSKFLGTYITPEKATGLEKKIQDIKAQGKAANIPEDQINTAIKNAIVGIPTPEDKPETAATLISWEKRFDIKSKEGPKTEEEYNRALELLAQSEDDYKPKYPTWKEALISEVKGIAKELKGEMEKEDFNLLLGIYMQKLEEIKTKYPEVNLEQFPEFEEMRNWLEKLKKKVGL